jgi:hypothetical protein
MHAKTATAALGLLVLAAGLADAQDQPKLRLDAHTRRGEKAASYTAHGPQLASGRFLAAFESGFPTNLVAPLSGYTARVRVHDTLCVYRLGAEWLYYFPKLQAALDPVFWVQSPAGQPHDGGPVAGRPVYPPVKPANFPGALPTQFLGLASGSISCPAAGAPNL